VYVSYQYPKWHISNILHYISFVFYTYLVPFQLHFCVLLIYVLPQWKKTMFKILTKYQEKLQNNIYHNWAKWVYDLSKTMLHGLTWTFGVINKIANGELPATIQISPTHSLKNVTQFHYAGQNIMPFLPIRKVRPYLRPFSQSKILNRIPRPDQTIKKASTGR